MPDFYRPYLTGLCHNKETRCVHGVSMSKRRVYSFQFLKKFDSESSFTLLPVVTSITTFVLCGAVIQKSDRIHKGRSKHLMCCEAQEA